jgi:hypothetical protein
VLQARLQDKERSERAAKEAATRKGLIGSGDRSDRIRTYNFPQGRLTDHRINLTLYKLALVMEGDLQDVVDALRAAREAELMAELEVRRLTAARPSLSWARGPPSPRPRSLDATMPFATAPPRPGAAPIAAVLLAGCQGGTPWGATPQQIPLPPLPRLENLPAHIEAGTTAGAQRIAERVRAALAAQPAWRGAALRVEGFEGGVMVLSGRRASAADRALAAANRAPGGRRARRGGPHGAP